MIKEAMLHKRAIESTYFGLAMLNIHPETIDPIVRPTYTSDPSIPIFDYPISKSLLISTKLAGIIP